MPLPIVLGIGAAIAGAVGVGSGIRGAVKMADAKNTVESANHLHKKNVARLEEKGEETNKELDRLGKLEMEILASFKGYFSDFWERLKNRPEINEIIKEGNVNIPKIDKNWQEVSAGAALLLGGLGGAGVGTAAGFAASGATSAAVMALGTASTGTAISTLSGVAATNATLAALGGGSLAAGGGGMALGSMILGGATLGVGLLIGGLIFGATGSSLSNKADEAWDEMRRAKDAIDKSCAFFDELSEASALYYKTLAMGRKIYDDHIALLKFIENKYKEKPFGLDYKYFPTGDKIVVDNTAKLAACLYGMCKVELVNKDESSNKEPSLNSATISKTDLESFSTFKEIETQMSTYNYIIRRG